MTRLAVASVAVAVSAAAFCLAPAAASAQDSGFGLGLIVGDPNGVSMKGFLNDRIAIDGAIGFSLLNGNHLYAHADFLWNHHLMDFDRAWMKLHFGVGPKLGMFFVDEPADDFIAVGARAPVGLTFGFERVPIDVFVEIGAGLWIVPNADFDLDAAAGARYFF